MDLMANTLLSVGASPTMVHSIQEIPDFTSRVSALCINVGTLSPKSLLAMITITKLCSQLDILWVLDPVAVSALSLRFDACVQLFILKPTVIRGNGSEIMALPSSHESSTSKGADSTHDSMDAVEAAKLLAQKSGYVVAVSGATDIVTNGYQVVGAHNGLTKGYAFDAAVPTLVVFGVVGELGMKMAKGPASLRMHLVVDVVTSCRFEVTNPGSEEVVLMKILQVFLACVKSEASVMPSNQHICTIVNTCFRIVHQAGTKKHAFVNGSTALKEEIDGVKNEHHSTNTQLENGSLISVSDGQSVSTGIVSNIMSDAAAILVDVNTAASSGKETDLNEQLMNEPHGIPCMLRGYHTRVHLPG
ncbi:hypothetical protein KIW84_040289 [Lathyrus oleraceus]|uniref:hydroxyethylthiazole kinase n=1 Tax=Pisum sativum TaxID=3888 RepID=A0A9D4X8A8_PEA|nr:hypothetical protein KIW84_040289 [Pisum sativum]